MITPCYHDVKIEKYLLSLLRFLSLPPQLANPLERKVCFLSGKTRVSLCLLKKNHSPGRSNGSRCRACVLIFSLCHGRVSVLSIARCQTFCNNVAQMNAFCFKLQSTIVTFCPLKLFKISSINFACHTRSFQKYPKKSSTKLQIILSPTRVVTKFLSRS